MHGDDPFWLFVLISLACFGFAVYVGSLKPKEEPLKIVEVDLGIDGDPNEPPPLGEPDAPAEPTPEMTPEPTPEPTPPPEPEKPEFVKPEEDMTPAPTPAATPATTPAPRKAPPKPSAAPRPVKTTGIGTPGATRGVPTGVVGGRGGSRSDFIAMPRAEYDYTAIQRKYQGSATLRITYSNGHIDLVEVSSSTGVPYLDSRSVSWVKGNWKVKPGSSGKVTLPITWQLH